MSDPIEPVVPPVEPVEPTPITQEQFDALNAEKTAMQTKLDELLTETKKAKTARREAEELAAREAEDKARKDGDFEQLLKSSEEKRLESESKLNEFQTNIDKEKLKSAAYKLGAEVADGENAELMAVFFEERLKPVDGDVKVTDKDGNLTVSTLADLKKEFESMPRYASLLRGNQSSGGGANGSGGNGGGAPKNQKAEDAKSKGDLTGFLNAQLSKT